MDAELQAVAMELSSSDAKDKVAEYTESFSNGGSHPTCFEVIHPPLIHSSMIILCQSLIFVL